MTTSLRSKIRKTEFVLDSISIHGNLIASEQIHQLSISPQSFNPLANYQIPKGFDINDAINNIWYRTAQAYWKEFKLSWAAIDKAFDNTNSFVQHLLTEVFGFKASISLVPSPSLTHEIRVPIVIAPFAYDNVQRNSSLDINREEFGNGRRKYSAFTFLQDYLNEHDESLWGIVTNGKTLRILRNNLSLTTAAYIEIDLEQIFEYNKYDEFRIAWLLLHASMFGEKGTPVEECALENMRKAGIENGSRIADRLRVGVKQALLALGNGFLKINPDLRQQIRDKKLDAQTYYNELLRIVYRLIFLITVEERELLHPKDTTKTARERYRDGYSFSRIRNRTIRRSAHDRYTDLWDTIQITFEGLANGQKEIGLPALGGLFERTQCPHLDLLKLRNDDFLEAAHNLLWITDETHLVRINWRDMGPEEFGSVYEGLLEITPFLSPAADHFSFVEFTHQNKGKGHNKGKGSERKSTGSYYTPDSLVQVILDNTLVPLIQRTIAQNQKDPFKALLALTIVDPACGSGHFLLSAARRLANKVAELRCPDSVPTLEERQRAQRDVIKNCIYGVDINPMAVELCRVALWLETIKPGEPLSFLDSHIQCGNSVLGTTPELMKDGIPDEAWQPDNPNGKTDEDKQNKAIAASLKKKNATERKKMERDKSYNHLIALSGITLNEHVATETQEIESAPENTIEEVRKKQSRYKQFLESDEYKRDRMIADTWCAAFLWNKNEELVEIAPTHALFEAIRNGHSPSQELANEVEKIAKQHRLFHWPLQFPQVFQKGGFDCVLGNPPWEKLKLQEEEFFATRSADIASAQGNTRKELIKALKKDCPALYLEYNSTLAHRKRETNFVISSRRYPFCGKGDINLYCIFSEHNRNIMKQNGVAGFIVPSGIACDDTTADFFVDLVKTNQLSKFYSFENREGLFPAVHRSYNFGLLMLEGEVSPCAAMATPYAATPSAGPQSPAPQHPSSQLRPDFVFYAHKKEDLNDDWRHFTMTTEDFATFNPNSHTCMTFRSQRDKELNAKIYRRAGGILWRDEIEQPKEKTTKPAKSKSSKSSTEQPSLFAMSASPFHSAQSLSSTKDNLERSQVNNPWQLKFLRMFDMTNDSKLFVDEHKYRALSEEEKDKYVPLYEAKYIHHFDSRFNTYKEHWKTRDDFAQTGMKEHTDADYTLRPRYYVLKSDVEAKLSGQSGKRKTGEAIHWPHRWFIGWRDISCPTNQRTLIASCFPYAGVGNKIHLIFSPFSNILLSCLMMNLSSYCLDYAVRNKLPGITLSHNYMKQFPAFPPSFYDRSYPFTNGEPLYKWIARRVVKLVCTHHDVCDFGREVLDELGEPDFMALPHLWNDADRNEIRCQLDAAFFVLYGMKRDEVEYILSTFNSKAPQSSSDDEEEDADEVCDTKRETAMSDDTKCEVYGNDKHKARILELFDAYI